MATNKAGIKRIFISTAFSAAQIQDIQTNKITGTPHIPVATSATPHPWHELLLDLDGTFDATRYRPTFNMGDQVNGVASVVGDRPDVLFEANFSVSDLSKANLFKWLSPDPRQQDDTARFVEMSSLYGVDMTSYSVSVIITDLTYGATTNATYGDQPKIGTGGDPAAIILYKASLWTSDYTITGGNTQQLIPVVLRSLSANGTTDLGKHGAYPADLTLFAAEA